MRAISRILILVIYTILLIGYILVGKPFGVAFILVMMVLTVVCVSFFFKRKNNTIAIQSEKNKEEVKKYEESLYISIATDGIPHLCFQLDSAVDRLEELFDMKLYKAVMRKGENWDFYAERLNENNQNRVFILFPNIFGWNYIYWQPYSTESIVSIVKQLSAKLNIKVNYYFNDGVTSYIQWVLSDNGNITRIYEKSMGTVLYDSGYLEIEEEVREKFKNDWDIYDELYKRTAQPIGEIDELKNTEMDVYVGEFNDNNNI